MGKKLPFGSGPLFEALPKGSFTYLKLLLSNSFPKILRNFFTDGMLDEGRLSSPVP